MNEKLREAWKRFIELGELSADVPSYIVDSWIRCREYGLDYNNPQKGVFLEDEEFRRICAKNFDLMQIATPIIEYLLKTLISIPTVITLSDAEENILVSKGDPDILDFAATANYGPGSKWSEKFVGTNAITLPLLLNRPVQLVGGEQFVLAHHETTSTGAPIHNESGEIIGTLSTLNMVREYSNHTLAMVAYAVETIEKEIRLINATEQMYCAFDSMSECVMLTDNEYQIKYLNNKCRQLFKEVNVINQDLREILRDTDIENLDSRIKDRNLALHLRNQIIHGFGSVNFIKFNGEMSGLSVVFRLEKAINKMVNKVSGNMAQYVFEDIITDNAEMKNVIEKARKLAATNCSMLICGESGTGKELFAQSIHNGSGRAAGPFVAINCGAIPRELVESEFFGYEEGSFTGARKNGSIGKFELANGGTIFLDEIGELPIEMQPKLLRVLDSLKVRKIGGSHEKKIDVRVIAATNRDLEKEIENKTFRLDLFYRLSVGIIEIPPLSKRKGDIPKLCGSFIKRFNQEGDKKIEGISEEFVECLQKHHFKGNVRELQNIVARAFYLCEGTVLTAGHLPFDDTGKAGKEEKEELFVSAPSKGTTMEEIEKEALLTTLKLCHGNITKTAEMMKLSKPTIYRKMKKYEINLGKTPIVE